MRILTIGVAAIALAVAAGAGAQGRGHGNGHSNGHGNAAHARASGSMAAAAHGHAMRAAAGAHGHGNGHTMRATAATQGHGNGHAMRATVASHGHGNGHAMRAANTMHAQAHGNGHATAKPGGPGNANGRGRAMAHQGNGHGASAAPAAGRAEVRNGNQNGGKPGVRVLADGRRYYSQRGARPSFDFAAVRRGPIGGCPPGLAKKNNGCMPPGLARQQAWSPDWWGLGGLGGRYYPRDGYLVRIHNNTIADYVPLLGGALYAGNPWPSYYAPVAAPDYYVNYYDLGPPGSYRYADNAFYRVDPRTSAITAIAALLTGNDFRIGAPMPAGYDIYNVPYAYRDRYADGPDAWYRYNDGYIYQIDPTTRLVTAAIEAIAS